MTTLDVLKRFEGAKRLVVDSFHLDRPILHVHLGLAVYVLAALLVRRRPGSLLPLLAVVAAEAVNEALDGLRYLVSGWPWTPRGTLRDLFDTLVWPVLLTVVDRLRR